MQIDKYRYATLAKQSLENHPNITLRMGMVQEILVDKDTKQVQGVRLRDGAQFCHEVLW